MTAAAPLPTTAPAAATPEPAPPVEKRSIEVLLPRAAGVDRRRLTLRLPAGWDDMSAEEARAVGDAVVAALCPSADAAAETAALRVGDPAGPGGVRRCRS